jgi:hypothetical protein
MNERRKEMLLFWSQRLVPRIYLLSKTKIRKIWERKRDACGGGVDG